MASNADATAARVVIDLTESGPDPVTPPPKKTKKNPPANPIIDLSRAKAQRSYVSATLPPARLKADDEDGSDSDSLPGPSGTSTKDRVKDTLCFLVPGPPSPKKRPGGSKPAATGDKSKPGSKAGKNKSHRYNASEPKEKAFRAAAKAQLQIQCPNHPLPIFGEGTPVAVHLVFGMKRPNDDFKARRRGPGRLKEGKRVERAVANFAADTDNLTKLALDALNKVAYMDDKQIVYLTALKIPDNYSSCEGFSSVKVRPIESNEMLDLALSCNSVSDSWVMEGQK